MTGLQIFKFDETVNAGTIHYPETGQSLRWARVEGVVWMHFADLCKGTGHGNPRTAINLVEDEDKSKLDMRDVFAGHPAVQNWTAGPTSGNAEAWFVNEDGFATLGLAGRGDGPRMFRRWVVKVVIPQFRQQTSEVAKRPATGIALLEEMVAELRAQHERVAVVEAKIAAIEGAHDWFTALAFAKLHGHPTNRPYLAKVGARAAALMRAQGQEPDRRQDATFGSVNVYPADVLEQAFEAVSR
jgi:prophage antirepressor-like protein